MAVTNIEINNDGDEDKYLFEENIYCAHSPLRIKFDVTYTGGVPPEECTIYIYECTNEYGIYTKGDLLGTFSAIPYEDNDTLTIRTFIFIADGIFKAYMDDLSDYPTDEQRFIEIPEATRDFWIEVSSQGRVLYPYIKPMMFLQRAHQFGQKGYVKIPDVLQSDLEDPFLESDEILESSIKGVFPYENIYYGAEDKPLYLYCMAKTADDLYILDQVYGQDYAFDWDDVVFRAPDDVLYRI